MLKQQQHEAFCASTLKAVAASSPGACWAGGVGGCRSCPSLSSF